MESQIFVWKIFYEGEVFSVNLISNWKKIGTAERLPQIDQSTSPGYRADYL